MSQETEQFPDSDATIEDEDEPGPPTYASPAPATPPSSCSAATPTAPSSMEPMAAFEDDLSDDVLASIPIPPPSTPVRAPPPAAAPIVSPPPAAETPAADEPPAHPCPAGHGTCFVLTSNTEKNPGRRFYRCPLRDNQGGCGHFEWVDEPWTAPPPKPAPPAAAAAPPPAASGAAAPAAQAAHIAQLEAQLAEARAAAARAAGGSSPATQAADPAAYKCPQGHACDMKTSRTSANPDRQFYKCVTCGHFLWADQRPSQAAAAASPTTPVRQAPPASAAPGRSPAGSGGSGSGNCFKCGQPGHWSRNCPSQPGGGKGAGAPQQQRRAGSCYKCGQEGHWSSNCPNGAPAAKRARTN